MVLVYIYANIKGVYWWDPCCHIYIYTIHGSYSYGCFQPMMNRKWGPQHVTTPTENGRAHRIKRNNAKRKKTEIKRGKTKITWANPSFPVQLESDQGTNAHNLTLWIADKLSAIPQNQHRCTQIQVHRKCSDCCSHVSVLHSVAQCSVDTVCILVRLKLLLGFATSHWILPIDQLEIVMANDQNLSYTFIYNTYIRMIYVGYINHILRE